MNHQPDIDEIYIYANDPYKGKYQYLITKREVLEQSILMILQILLNTRMIWMIFIKTLKITGQIRNLKY